MLLTRKAQASAAPQARLARGLNGVLAKTMDRRAFLKRSGVTLGVGAAAAQLPFNVIGDAQAASEASGGAVQVKRTICSHCSVGCAIDAVVQNGVWIRQEPVFDSPLNLGAHCAKGAAVREHGMVHDSHRLKTPMKLEGGKWKRVSWDQAYKEIGDKLLAIKKDSGPDALFILGSSKHNNEQSYLLRKWISLWGSNNVDHQARICHSTTVAGIANTWGYGAMTNSYNDEQNSKCLFFLGSNAAEAHPVSMLHTLHAKENGAKVIVADPRYTRTAAKADKYVRFRSGTDVAFLFGLVYHIFKNGWEDKEYIRQRVYGMDKVKDEVLAKYTPDAVADVTGVSEKDMYDTAKMLADNRPGFIIWAMGQTQHTNGNAVTRASAVLMLALGNAGRTGGGANIYRGHDNVQGATDVGPNAQSLPGYYGLSGGAFKHWARVWNVDLDWLKKQYANEKMMGKNGFTVSRWHDAVLENKEALDQDTNLRAVIFWGHAPNSQSRGPDQLKAMEKLDLMVVIDPYPSASAAMFAKVRKDGAYLLPAATQFECAGSITASNRSIQWREQVIEPLFESRNDHMIMYQLAEKLGFGDQLIGKRNGKQNIKLVKGRDGLMEPDVEDVLREINAGTWTIGYTGQSPERIQAHMRNLHVFDVKTLRARGGKDAKTGYDLTGDYFGLPWPCWGNDKVKHPGTPNLYDTSKSVMDGGGTFRARYGVEKDGVNLLAEDAHSVGSEIKTGYPEFDHKLLKKLGWWDDLTPEEKAEAEGKNWKTDLSGGIQRVALKHACVPFGNAKARALVWNFPDAVPLHREPLYSPRPDLVAKWPTHEDKKHVYRVPTLFKTVQDKSVADKDSEKFPLILTSGRLVEYEGGGEETRSNPWLAELQQDNFVELSPKAAADRGIRNGEYVWVSTPSGAKIKVKAMVTERVGNDTVFIPFHFSGWWQGEDMLKHYPEGSAPIVRGEAVNTATTYGYDIVTNMQETKTTLCQVARA
ncbi:MAG: formate dehydrogenase [Betaproteobacteria bacterium SG8_39]|nr:MAG: formate dehydrogenase [Betaproteobacteria bacterium SG8_39]